MLRRIPVLLLLLATSVALAESLDDYTKNYMKARGIPAVVWGIFKDGKVIKSQAYGLANVELNVPATTDNIFEIGSVSKQFTATAILMLREQGKLALDDRLEKYVSELPEKWKPVTIKQLLSHSSGIPDIEEIFGYDSYRNIYTPKAIIDVANSKPMDFEPGKGWHYSNTGYFLLAMILEKVTGKPYGVHMKETIFDPLGMTHTRESSPTVVIPNRASGYQMTEAGLGNRDAMQPTACNGAGTLVSNLEDMAKWDDAITRHRFLKPETQEMMWTATQIPEGPVPYGFGWFNSPWRGHPSVEHSGGTAGYSCDFRRFLDLGISVMVFTNLYATGVEGIEIRAADTVFPGLSYVSAKVIPEPKPGQKEKFLEAVGAVAKNEKSDLFTENMWKAYTAASHQAWKDRLAGMKSFELVSYEKHEERKTPYGEGVVETYVYRLTSATEAIFIRFMLTPDGKIAMQNRLDY